MKRLRRARELLAQPNTWVRVHGGLVIVWALLMIPSILWWQNSVAWIVLMSAWANLAGSLASWQAARADQHSVDATDFARVEAKIDAVRRMLRK